MPAKNKKVDQLQYADDRLKCEENFILNLLKYTHAALII